MVKLYLTKREFSCYLYCFYHSEPNQEIAGQASIDRGGAPGNNKMVRGANVGNNTHAPHDPRAGPAIPTTSENRNVRYNGGGGPTAISNQAPNTGNVKWGSTAPHDNRSGNARGGHSSTKDKMR